MQEVELSEGKLADIRFALLKWFEKNGRHWIPWKLNADGLPPKPGEVIDPYPILVAEVMLQQTQLKTVLPYWEKWMKTFPTLLELANANEQEVLLLWQGLGYYSRARRLHQASKVLLNSIGAKDLSDTHSWPKDLEGWMELPGIGRSTAASIVSSAFDAPSPIMDGNVQRFLCRFLAIPSPPLKVSNQLWKFINKLIDTSKPRDFNQALMDLGYLVCRPKDTFCTICPVNEYCIAYSLRKVASFPVKTVPKELPFSVVGVGVVINHLGQILIAQRLEKGMFGGMWEFPGGKQEQNESIETTVVRELKEELSIDVDIFRKLISLEHIYSHKKLRFEVYLCNLVKGVPLPMASQQVKWVRYIDLKNYPFPMANSKMIEELGKYFSRNNLKSS